MPVCLCFSTQRTGPDFARFKMTLDVYSGAMNMDSIDVFNMMAVVWMHGGTSEHTQLSPEEPL